MEKPKTSGISATARWQVIPVLGGYVVNLVDDGRRVANGPAFLVPPEGTEEAVRWHADCEVRDRNAALEARQAAKGEP